ncbi:hypothetical protein XENOCAPTIV_008620 [Xenoophorus captivus]|uniref:Uncharacterized protein n=1 Tax=Xenoophorus captivus TaxID=1517983 RepID=A0ABV0QQN9_9TELE
MLLPDISCTCSCGLMEEPASMEGCLSLSHFDICPSVCLSTHPDLGHSDPPVLPEGSSDFPTPTPEAALSKCSKNIQKMYLEGHPDQMNLLNSISMQRSRRSTLSSCWMLELLIIISKAEPDHPTEETHSSCLDPGSGPFSHDPYLRNIV